MKKRLFAFVLAALMILAACTNAAVPKDTATAPEPVEAETATQVPEQKPVQAEEKPQEEPSSDEYTLEREAGCNQLTIYWTAPSINFDTSDVWIWYGEKAGKGYLFHPCKYGAKCVVNVPESEPTVGFIVRTGCSEPGGTAWGTATKDFGDDRFVNMNGDTEIYLKTGEGTIYYSEDGGMNLYQKLSFHFAGIVEENKIKYMIEPAARLSSLDQFAVYCGDQKVEIANVSSLNNEVNNGTIELKEPVDVSALYTVEIEGYGKHTAVPTGIFDSKAFIENYTYDGDDLGAVITEEGTTFKVWAPTASKVVLNLFKAGNDCDTYATVDMERGERGVWSTVQDCGHGTYYTYTVTTAVGTQEAVDPYAKAVGVNGNRGMVVDLKSTDPEGFAEEQFDANLSSYRDAIIWEVHVRDFSNRLEASNYKGKYLAFTETGLTNNSGIPAGVDYIRQLGVTHVHLQPVYDFATVDESSSKEEFNWGYDPKNYNAPEGSYSTDPYHGEVRINEFKQMVQALHAQGLGVVMDVVYNHTYDGNSCLNKIVPYYYYRYTATGENANGSGCGNETASDRYMFRKYMIDSVSYWQKEYHIDGFRFDLMGLHDTTTMQKIENAVHTYNPQALLYGEGWTGDTSPLNPSQQAVQKNIKNVKASRGAIGSVAVFNDAIRDGLKGSVFDSKAKGYISGDPSKGNANKILFGITGGEHKVGVTWRIENAMIINYMSSHDNRTLWDILANGAPSASKEERIAMNRLGATVVLISKGTPFWLAGEEMLRTKNGDENSYKSSDEVNNIKWDVLQEGSDEYAMVEFYRSLIELRKAHDWIRNSNVTGEVLEENNALKVLYADGEKTEGAAFVNPGDAPMTVTLPEGTWTVLLGGTGTVSGTAEVPAKGVLLLEAN